MSIPFSKKQSGHSLMEVVLACGVLAIIAVVFTIAIIDVQETNILAGNNSRASLLAEEGLEAVRNIRDESFSNLHDGTYGIAINNNQWQLEGENDISGIFTRQIIISTDENSTTTKNVISKVTWQQNLQREGQIILKTHLTNWRGN